MNPNPFAALNHLTVPVATETPPLASHERVEKAQGLRRSVLVRIPPGSVATLQLDYGDGWRTAAGPRGAAARGGPRRPCRPGADARDRPALRVRGGGVRELLH